MIDGITVLSQNEIMSTPMRFWVIAIVGIIICMISIIVMISSNEKSITNIFFISSIVCIIIFAISALCGVFIKNGTGKYTYKVTISDEVNFVEFNNKYEIIDKEGLIYTIKEKETNNGFN